MKERGEQREKAFDIAKGIGMLAVILGHMSIPESLGDVIFSFHMPLFFLINGYFFKKKESNNGEYIVLKIKTLILPYIVTCGLVIVFSIVFQLQQRVEVTEILENVKSWILASFYGSGTFTHFLKWNFRIIGAIWFLLAMFWADVIFHFLLKTKNPYVYGSILSIIGYVTAKIVWLPMSVQAGLSAIFFVQIGYFIKQKNILKIYEDNKQAFYLSAIFWCMAILYSGKLYMVGNNYGGGLLDVIGAICAAFLILKFSKFLEKKCKKIAELLSLYGKNSLIVLCFHLIELNTFTWSILSGQFSYVTGLVIVFVCKVIWSIAMIFMVYKIPLLRNVYNVKQKVNGERGV
ncbi:acyltransferase family protein [Faecalimonas sp.]